MGDVVDTARVPISGLRRMNMAPVQTMSSPRRSAALVLPERRAPALPLALIPRLAPLPREPPPLRPTRRLLPPPTLVPLPVARLLALLLALSPGLAPLASPVPPPAAVCSRAPRAVLPAIATESQTRQTTSHPERQTG